MFRTPVVVLVGGDAPTRVLLRFLLEDAGASAAGVQAPTLVLTQGMSLQVRQRALARGVLEVIALPLGTRLLQTHLRCALASATNHAHRGTTTTLPISGPAACPRSCRSRCRAHESGRVEERALAA